MNHGDESWLDVFSNVLIILELFKLGRRMCTTYFMGKSLFTWTQAAISLNATLSRFRMSKSHTTEKSSEICQVYGLVPSKTECKFFRIGWNFQIAMDEECKVCDRTFYANYNFTYAIILLSII